MTPNRPIMKEEDKTRVRHSQRDYNLGFNIGCLESRKVRDDLQKKAQETYGMQGRSAAICFMLVCTCMRLLWSLFLRNDVLRVSVISPPYRLRLSSVEKACKSTIRNRILNAAQLALIQFE